MLADAEFKMNFDELADRPMGGRQTNKKCNHGGEANLAKEALKLEYIMHVIDVASDLNEYLEKVHDHSDADPARYDAMKQLSRYRLGKFLPQLLSSNRSLWKVLDSDGSDSSISSRDSDTHEYDARIQFLSSK